MIHSENYSMHNKTIVPSLIPLFQGVAENLRYHRLESALSGVHSILACDPRNFYAAAIERRLMRLMDLRQNTLPGSHTVEYSLTRVFAALEHICHLAVQQCTHLSAQASIHNMNHQMREQVL